MKTEIKKRDGATPQQVAYINDLKVTTAGNYVAANDTFGTAIGKLDTAIHNIPAQKDYSISVSSSTSVEGVAKQYTITQTQATGGTTSWTIDIPKDMVVSSGRVVTNPDGQDPGTYIELTLANAASDKIYINVANLFNDYTAAQNATKVQLTIGNDHVISATLVANSVTATELATDAVTTAKIADGNVTKAKLDSDVQASLDKADTALQSHQDISGKADKDTDAVTGNLAEFDANHNPVDSGKKVSDFALDGHSHAISDVTGLQGALDGKVDAVSGKGLSTEDYTTAEKTKLDGIAAGAEVNQNAFSAVTVGATTVSAGAKTDTLTLVGGTNVTITPDAANKTITITAAATDITGKADRVSGATNGNFAGLDSNGNLTDSGKKASDFAEATHSHTADQVTGLATVATSGNYSDLNGAKSADGTTIQDSSNVFSVKDGGIGTAKLAANAVTTEKLGVLTSFQIKDSAADGPFKDQVYTITILNGAIMVTPV